jgi:hypothetical protein
MLNIVVFLWFQPASSGCCRHAAFHLLWGRVFQIFASRISWCSRLGMIASAAGKRMNCLSLQLVYKVSCQVSSWASSALVAYDAQTLRSLRAISSYGLDFFPSPLVWLGFSHGLSFVQFVHSWFECVYLFCLFWFLILYSESSFVRFDSTRFPFDSAQTSWGGGGCRIPVPVLQTDCSPIAVNGQSECSSQLICCADESISCDEHSDHPSEPSSHAQQQMMLCNKVKSHSPSQSRMFHILKVTMIVLMFK